MHLTFMCFCFCLFSFTVIYGGCLLLFLGGLVLLYYALLIVCCAVVCDCWLCALKVVRVLC